MIVGNGLLANAFRSYEDSDEVCIFASGVSNSLEVDSRKFQREQDLLIETISKCKGHMLVYFGTSTHTSANEQLRKYFLHKLKMEKLVSESEHYLICRLPQVVGRIGNPANLMNFLVNSIRHGRRFELWEFAERNFLDVDDIVDICSQVIRLKVFNKAITVANPRSHKVVEVVAQIEKMLQKPAVFDLVRKGNPMQLDTTFIENHCRNVAHLSTDEYLPKLLEKYYSK